MDPLSLSGYPVRIEIPVQWGEMDAYGHVNNTVFFRYFESARIGYLEACGFIESYETNRVGAILHSTACRFRRPLGHPDTVIAAARASAVGEDRFTMEYRVFSTGLNDVAATGSGIVVSFDYTAQSKAPLPTSVLEGIERVEGRPIAELAAAADS